MQTQPPRAVQLALFGGSLGDAEGSPQALVVYHYYESLTMCEEDEEVQVIRANLLTFLRYRGGSVHLCTEKPRATQLFARVYNMY